MPPGGGLTANCQPECALPSPGSQPIPVHYWLDQLIPELTGQGNCTGDRDFKFAASDRDSDVPSQAVNLNFSDSEVQR